MFNFVNSLLGKLRQSNDETSETTTSENARILAPELLVAAIVPQPVVAPCMEEVGSREPEVSAPIIVPAKPGKRDRKRAKSDRRDQQSLARRVKNGDRLSKAERRALTAAGLEAGAY